MGEGVKGGTVFEEEMYSFEYLSVTFVFLYGKKQELSQLVPRSGRGPQRITELHNIPHGKRETTNDE